MVDSATLALAVSPAVAALCDLVEFRADALAGQTEAVAAAMQACPIPALLTVRAPEEGGIGQLSNEAREKIFTALLPRAGLIDIEIAHLAGFSHLVSAARARGIPVIASFHDFHGTPDRATLEALIEKATAAGSDAVKFATTLRNSQDLATLTSLQDSATQPLATRQAHAAPAQRGLWYGVEQPAEVGIVRDSAEPVGHVDEGVAVAATGFEQ